MYEYNDDIDNTQNKANNSKYILVLGGIIFFALIIILMPKLFGNSNKKYSELENKLVESAKAYVINNNVTTTSEIYLDVKTLGITIDKDCSATSGVIFDGKNYKANLICNDYKSDTPEKNREDIEYQLIPSEKTTDDVTIILLVNDNNFDYIELPNTEIKNDKYITYIVSDNGTYTFNIFDKNGNKKEKNIIVNNISIGDYGSCIAKWKNESTEVTVNINDNIVVNTYEYVINDKTEAINSLNNYSSKTIKPSNVFVKIKLSDNNLGKIKCSIDEKIEPQIVTDEKGKNCLEGYICYVQYDYQSSNYPFCSMDPNEKPNSCGGIGGHGCSLTSAAIAMANLGAKSSNGELYNPFTVWEEVYPFYDKKIGACWGGCSGWSKIKQSLINAGLSTSEKYQNFNSSAYNEILEHLRKGYPVIVHATDGPYTAGSGHYMTILATRVDNMVYISDPALKDGIKKEYEKGKQYYADTWVTLDDLRTGRIDNYLLVGPPGTF